MTRLVGVHARDTGSGGGRQNENMPVQREEKRDRGLDEGQSTK
jgi:hypothetical protein